MPKSEGSPSRSAFRDYYAHFSSLLPLAFAVTMVIVVTVLLAQLFPVTLVVTIPLLLIPFLFAFVVSSSRIVSDDPLALKTFYRFLLPGMNPSFRRLIRPYLAIIKTGLVYLATLFLAAFLAQLLAPSLDPTLTVVLENLVVMTEDTTTIAELNQFLVANATSLNPFFIALTLAGGFIAYVFIVFDLSTRLPGLYLALAVPTAVASLDIIHRSAYRLHRKTVIKWLLIHQWPSWVALIIGYALGAMLGIFLHAQPLVVSTLALVGGVFLSGLLLPHFFGVLAAIYDQLAPDYFKAAHEEILSLLASLDEMTQLSDEQKAAIRRMFEEDVSKAKEHGEDEEENKKLP